MAKSTLKILVWMQDIKLTYRNQNHTQTQAHTLPSKEK